MKELTSVYNRIKPRITERLKEFKDNYHNGNDQYVFQELAFCILTPQSKARACFAALEKLVENGLLYHGSPEEIRPFIRSVRFLNKKSCFLVRARQQFSEYGVLRIKDFIESYSNIPQLRNWISENVKGIGQKEAGHFLRNIGKGHRLAILDRHILKNLVKYNVIKEIPVSLSRKKYNDIETQLLDFSDAINIPPDHLDFLFWYMEAGEVFK